MVDQCSTVQYPTTWGFKREPSRPVHLRIDYCNGMKFNDNFDWNNLWYDAVQVNATTVLLIGPPLYSTKDWLTINAKFTDQTGNFLPFNSIEIDRACYTTVTVNQYVNFITMHTNNSKTHIQVNHQNGLFSNEKVMVTLQKNNPIAWIQQWITYHKKVLGVDAFLIYDNASTLYTSKELEHSLLDLGAIVTIVDWPYPYGPQGSDFAPWDSDYGQYGMLEHAKIRYLNKSKLVLNNDIDELVITNGITLENVATYLNANNVKCIRYRGIWIEPWDIVKNQSANKIPLEQRQFKDYFCTDPNNKIGIGHKWMLTPTTSILKQQWLVHNINGLTIETDQLRYAHYLAMNTGWSWSRDQFNGNVNNLVTNQLLLNHLKSLG